MSAQGDWFKCINKGGDNDEHYKAQVKMPSGQRELISTKCPKCGGKIIRVS